MLFLFWLALTRLFQWESILFFIDISISCSSSPDLISLSILICSHKRWIKSWAYYSMLVLSITQIYDFSPLFWLRTFFHDSLVLNSLLFLKFCCFSWVYFIQILSHLRIVWLFSRIKHIMEFYLVTEILDLSSAILFLFYSLQYSLNFIQFAFFFQLWLLLCLSTFLHDSIIHQFFAFFPHQPASFIFFCWAISAIMSIF